MLCGPGLITARVTAELGSWISKGRMRKSPEILAARRLCLTTRNREAATTLPPEEVTEAAQAA